MTEIVVDTDALRWKISNLGVYLWSIRHHSQPDIHEATQMATGYGGQLYRKVMAIAGQDESLVRALADELEEMIYRLTQIVEAFEAADAIRISNPALGSTFTWMVDRGLLLSSLPSWSLPGELSAGWEERLWARLEPGEGNLLLSDAKGYLQAFASSPFNLKSGTEADLWKAFSLFLFVQGAIQTPPDLETWRSAAQAAGMELEAYVAATSGVKEGHVAAWFRAAETHEIGLEAVIDEIFDMVQAGETIEQHFGFSMEGNWTESDKDDIVEGVLMLSHALREATPEADTAAGVFQAVFGGDATFELKEDGVTDGWFCTGGGFGFICEPLTRDHMSPQLAVHELGHSLNARVSNNLNARVDEIPLLKDQQVEKARRELLTPYGQLRHTEITAEVNGEVIHVTGRPPEGGYERTDLGYASLGPPWQQHSIRWDNYGNTAGEDFADMLLGWTFDGFTDDPAGQARYAWMDEHMAEWVDLATEPFDEWWLEDTSP